MTIQGLVRSALFLMILPLSNLLGCAADTTAPLSPDSGAAGISVNATPSTLKGTVGVPFAGGAGVVFSVSGGTAGASYYWTVTGSLPPGLAAFPPDNLNPSSTLTLFGMPSTGGLYPLQISVHTAPNHALLVSGANFPIEIAGDSNSSPVIPSLSLTWLTGVPYQQALTATGGRTPYASWFATGLPPDITLNTQTGTLSGTPSTPGTYNVTVSVVDAAGRTGTGTVSLTVKTWTLAEIKGTWTGMITTDPHRLNGKRLSLLFNDLGIVQQGTMDATVLATSAQPLSFTIDSGQLNGPISILGWHLVCDPTSSGDLACIGHDVSGVTPTGDITLRRINTNSQDSGFPTVINNPNPFTSNGMGGTVTVTFSELMSGTGTVGTSITLSGSGTVGTPTFASTDPTALDARTLTILLSQLQSSTNYTLTLNPSGQTGFRDIAGNALATEAIPFTTGALNVNQRPTATSLTLSATVNTPRTITLAGSDPENGALTFTVVAQPTVGTLTGTAPNLTYTSNVIGRDSFTFTVTDPAFNTSAPATITIDTRAANRPPTATSQTVSGIHDRPLAITLTGSDPDVGDTLAAYTIVVGSGPSNGAITAGTGATKTYTPRAGFIGPDSFGFTVTDSVGAVSAPATVAIAVTNRSPTASPQAITVLKYELGSSTAITLAGADPDGDTLMYTVADSVPSPTHGAITGGTGAARTYFPPPGYSGPDGFSFTVSDGVSTSAAATLTITVSPNPPPTANPQTFTFTKRQQTMSLSRAQHAITLTGSASAVGFQIIRWPSFGQIGGMGTGGTYQFVDPITGSVSQRTATTSSSVDGTTRVITVSPLGSPFTIIYTPNLCHIRDFAQDSFTFVAIDADGLASAPATVTANSTTNLCVHSF